MNDTTPNPGIHLNVPFQSYLAWDALSQTDIKNIAKAPAIYEYWRGKQTQPTPAQLTGTVCHTAVLEPELFDKTYKAMDKPDQRSKKNKEAWKAAQDEAAAEGRTIISMDDYDLASRIRDSVRSHPEASKLLNVPGDKEVSLRWDWTGLSCKGRIDWLPKQESFIVDLKTCLSAAPGPFNRAVLKYGYHIQAWWYEFGFSCSRGTAVNARSFRIIAAEKHPPYLVSVWSLSEQLLFEARKTAIAAADTFSDCTDSGRWPGYSDELQELTLPEWATPTNGDEDDDCFF